MKTNIKVMAVVLPILLLFSGCNSSRPKEALKIVNTDANDDYSYEQSCTFDGTDGVFDCDNADICDLNEIDDCYNSQSCEDYEYLSEQSYTSDDGGKHDYYDYCEDYNDYGNEQDYDSNDDESGNTYGSLMRPQGSVYLVEGKTVFVTIVVNDNGAEMETDDLWYQMQYGKAAAQYIENIANLAEKRVKLKCGARRTPTLHTP